MTVETLTYDCRDVNIIWGALELEAPADGTFVTIDYDEDAVKKTAGAQGHVTATINANDGGSVTWVATQGTPTNDRLSAAAALQRKKDGPGLIKAPIIVKHVNGTTICTGMAWIKKVAKAEFAAEATSREWVFDIDHLVMFVGGSTR